MKKKILILAAILFSNLIYSQENLIVIENILAQEIENINSEVIIYGLITNNEFENEIQQKLEVSKDENLNFNDFVNCLGISYFKKIKANFSSRKKTDNNFIYLLNLPNKLNYGCLKESIYKKNHQLGIPLETGIYYYKTSDFIFIDNLNYVIFEFFTGEKGSMSGGIKIYKKDSEENYEPICTLNSWIE